MRHGQSPRFPSPLIKPDVRFSRIRLSDGIHREAHDGGRTSARYMRGHPHRLRLSTQPVRTSLAVEWCLQAQGQSPWLFSVFPSVSEVRGLSSAGITRPRRSYTPVRLPSAPSPPSMKFGAATPNTDGSPPIARITYVHRAVSTTPANRKGAYVDAYPFRAAFPGNPAGRRSHLDFRGLLSPRIPVRGSHSLRPDVSLDRPRRPLSRGSDPTGYPAKPLVSYQIHRHLSGWNLPPLVIRTHSGRT